MIWAPGLRKNITHVCGRLLGCDARSTGLGLWDRVAAELTRQRCKYWMPVVATAAVVVVVLVVVAVVVVE